MWHVSAVGDEQCSEGFFLQPTLMHNSISTCMSHYYPRQSAVNRCSVRPLRRARIPDAVFVQLFLLRMGMSRPETCRGLTRQIHIEWQSKHNYVYVICKVLVYVQTSQPTTCFGLFQLGRLQVGHKGWRKYTIMQNYH